MIIKFLQFVDDEQIIDGGGLWICLINIRQLENGKLGFDTEDDFVKWRSMVVKCGKYADCVVWKNTWQCRRCFYEHVSCCMHTGYNAT